MCNEERKKARIILSSTLQSLRSCIPASSTNQFLTIQFHTRNAWSHLFLFLFFNNLFLVFLVITSFVFGNRASDKSPCNSQDQNKPEDVDGLQSKEQGKGNDLRDPAFVLLGFPVEFVGADGAEAGQSCPEDVQIQVVAEVEPNTDEEAKVWASDG